ncbi:hypothetical protein ABT160_23720 [Streptomyces sp. NPDC001941]
MTRHTLSSTPGEPDGNPDTLPGQPWEPDPGPPPSPDGGPRFVDRALGSL